MERKFDRGAAADLWRHTLAQIPTVFGRLVYLATLRDANTGVYEHHGLSQIFGEEEADRTLRQSHIEMFNEWLCFWIRASDAVLVSEQLQNCLQVGVVELFLHLS